MKQKFLGFHRTHFWCETEVIINKDFFPAWLVLVLVYNPRPPPSLAALQPYYNHTTPLKAHFHNTSRLFLFQVSQFALKFSLNFSETWLYSDYPSPQSCTSCQMTDSIFLCLCQYLTCLKLLFVVTQNTHFSVKNMKRITWFTNVETLNQSGPQRVEPAWTVTPDRHRCPEARKRGWPVIKFYDWL